MGAVSGVENGITIKVKPISIILAAGMNINQSPKSNAIPTAIDEIDSPANTQFIMIKSLA